MDSGIQLLCKSRNVRTGIGAYGHDHIPALEAATVTFDSQLWRCATHARDSRAMDDREFEKASVRLQVIGGFILGGERALARRKRQPRQAIVLRGRKQHQRVPPAAPRVARPHFSVHDQKRSSGTLQVMPGRKTGLPSAHDDGIITSYP